MCALSALCAIRVGFAGFISFCVLIRIDAWTVLGQRLRAAGLGVMAGQGRLPNPPPIR
jgi:hypothetical protein